MAGFVDVVRIEARGGDGGAGVAAFQKRKGKPKGKPRVNGLKTVNIRIGSELLIPTT